MKSIMKNIGITIVVVHNKFVIPSTSNKCISKSFDVEYYVKHHTNWWFSHNIQHPLTQDAELLIVVGLEHILKPGTENKVYMNWLIHLGAKKSRTTDLSDLMVFHRTYIYLHYYFRDDMANSN